MGYLAVDLAIYERLVGAPLDSSGRPLVDSNGVPKNRLLIGPPLAPDNLSRLPSYGVRVPLVQQPRNTNGGSSHNPPMTLRDVSHRNYRQVPVFPVNDSGIDYADKWPCVTYYYLEEEFNPKTYIYSDDFVEPAPTAPVVDVVNRNDLVIATGKARTRTRRHPDAYDLFYLIRVWSKNKTELVQMMESVKRIFPARGALEVEQYDGTKLCLDMNLDRVENLDTNTREISAVLDSDEQRGFSRGLVYRVESYVDNTVDDQASWEDVIIRQRILELADVQANIIENVGPVDLLVAGPIDQE